MGTLSSLAGLTIFCGTKSETRGGRLSLSLRKQVLEKMGEELSRGNDPAALSLIKQSQNQPGGLRCFGAARQVPQSLYSWDELKLSGIEAASLLSPVDSTLGSIERNLQIVDAGGVAAWNAFGLSPQQLLYTSLGLLFLWTLDLVSFDRGIGSLVQLVILSAKSTPTRLSNLPGRRPSEGLFPFKLRSFAERSLSKCSSRDDFCGLRIH